MKFNTGAPSSCELRVGNVYPAQGKQTGTFWLVVGIMETTVAVLRLDGAGNIVGAQTYGKHVFDGSNKHFTRNDCLLGTCEALQKLEFDIDWTRHKEVTP